MHLTKNRWVNSAIILVSALLLANCQARTSALEPRGYDAQQIANLWWFMLIVATAIYIGVMGILVVALFRRRNQEADVQAPPPPWSHSFIVGAGIVFPTVVLGVLFVLTLQTMNVVAAGDEDDALLIEVIGRRWWWQVRYPQYGFETANEIYIPAGERVQLKLTSADVNHSFWVPELHGKIDMIRGRTNTIWLEAQQAGEFWGQCAEYCGLQHAHMAFYVIAADADDFEAWLTLQQQPAPEPDNALTLQGQQTFLGSSCVYCHTIRGTNANSDLGPDLTHFASRKTIGAGAVPNTRGHLAGWIIDSQGIKPGNLMPPMYLESEDLNALLAYMETLR